MPASPSILEPLYGSPGGWRAGHACWRHPQSRRHQSDPAAENLEETRRTIRHSPRDHHRISQAHVVPECVARCVRWMLSKMIPSFKELATVMDCCEPQEHMTPRLTPSREVLRTRTQCPGCGKVITFHALAYRHKCPRIPNTWEGKKQRQLAALHARINARIPVPEPQVIPEPAVA